MPHRGDAAGRSGRRGSVLAAMLDSNVFDRIDDDPEAASELAERRDLRLYVSEVQLAELAAIVDEDRRERLLALARSLCVRVSAAIAAEQGRGPGTGSVSPVGKHAPDALIAAAASARCALLVSDDEGLLRKAREDGLRALSWDGFLSRHVFGR